MPKQVWGRRGAERWLLDQVRARMDFVATCQAVQTLSNKWPQATAKLVEDKANGPAVISALRSKVPGMIAVQVKGGKEARAHAVSPMVEAGNVYLPDPSKTPWVSEFIEELATFPGPIPALKCHGGGAPCRHRRQQNRKKAGSLQIIAHRRRIERIRTGR